MKSRQWLIPLGLLALVLTAIVGSFLTADFGSSGSSTGAAHKSKLVDESPLQTAQAMGKLATGIDEIRIARQAEETADNAVDLAFHDALRDAADHPPAAKPQFKPLEQRVNEAKEQVKSDQDAVNDLKKRLATADATHQENLQEQLDVAQAQLELDQDELNDAHGDLVRAGGDPGALIQRQFDKHQATEHGTDQKLTPQTQASAPPTFQSSSMVGQFLVWRELHGTIDQLEQAHDKAVAAVTTVTQKHEELEKQVDAEKADFRAGIDIGSQEAATGSVATVPAAAASKTPSAATPATSNAPDGASAMQTSKNAVKALHIISDDQKTLADLDKRIQDQQELQSTYVN
ncbi:MAG TPA: hypothetical protein VF753_00070, partial [Terriglobales bacterium]